MVLTRDGAAVVTVDRPKRRNILRASFANYAASRRQRQ
jgi:hypothetical protein